MFKFSEKWVTVHTVDTHSGTYESIGSAKNPQTSLMWYNHINSAKYYNNFKWTDLYGNHVYLWQFHNTWPLVCQCLSLRFPKGLKIPSYAIGCRVWLAFHLQILLGAFAKFRKKTISFVMSVRLSVCPNGTARHQLDGFSWNMIQLYENVSRKFKFHSNRGIFLLYLAHFFLEWEMFHTKVVDKIKTHVCSVTFFFRKSCRLWDHVEKYCTAGQPQMTTWRMRTACWIPKATNTHAMVV
jgi:hypothetical protein